MRNCRVSCRIILGIRIHGACAGDEVIRMLLPETLLRKEGFCAGIRAAVLVRTRPFRVIIVIGVETFRYLCLGDGLALLHLGVLYQDRDCG